MALTRQRETAEVFVARDTARDAGRLDPRVMGKLGRFMDAVRGRLGHAGHRALTAGREMTLPKVGSEHRVVLVQVARQFRAELDGISGVYQVRSGRDAKETDRQQVQGAEQQLQELSLASKPEPDRDGRKSGHWPARQMR